MKPNGGWQLEPALPFLTSIDLRLIEQGRYAASRRFEDDGATFSPGWPRLWTSRADVQVSQGARLAGGPAAPVARSGFQMAGHLVPWSPMTHCSGKRVRTRPPGAADGG